MKTLLIITAALIFAASTMAATTDELRQVLVDSDNYIAVGEPVKLSTRSTSPMARTGQKYSIVLLKQSDADTLVATTKAIYLWVVDYGEPTEDAYFIGKNPTAETPTNFADAVRAFMIANSFDGHLSEVRTLGDVESAVVTRYVDGTDGQHYDVQEIRVTRTGGTAWAYKIKD